MEETLKKRLRDIQDNMDIKQSIMYIIFTNPQIYLGKLIKRTIYIGLVTFVLSWIYTHSSLKNVVIPSTTHSLIGIVIGLLLVFRTNTAYDRWWEGRKCISSISNAMCFYIMKLRSMAEVHGEDTYHHELVRDFQEKSRAKFSELLDDLQKFLSQADDRRIITIPFHKAQMSVVTKLLTEMNALVEVKAIRKDQAHSLETYLNSIMEHSNNCERIKNTPIPLGFLLHIKTSIFIYLLSLPIGLFHDLGMMSTFIIMTIYYVIGGIEIISNEIENPFAGDPNDLPVVELLNNIKESIK
jgi:putative membrane protein